MRHEEGTRVEVEKIALQKSQDSGRKLSTIAREKGDRGKKTR